MSPNGDRNPPSDTPVMRYEYRCACPRGPHLVLVTHSQDGYRARLADLDQPWSPVAWPDAETAVRDALDTHLEAEATPDADT